MENLSLKVYILGAIYYSSNIFSAFSFSVGAGSIPMMILTFILFIATFGAGFTLKKKYRENNWL